MGITRKNFLILTLSSFLLAITSCGGSREPSATYTIGSEEDDGSINLPLLEWHVCGAFSLVSDSLQLGSIVKNPHQLAHMTNPDTTETHWHNGVYQPLYNQMDLKEVFGIDAEDTTQMLKDKVVYLYCDLLADKDMNVYADVRTSIPCIHFLNGDTLQRRDIQGLNIYPLHLHEGHNTYLVRAIAQGNDYSFEATLRDSISMARIYAEGQSCNIIFPQIRDNIIMLTNAHQRVMDATVTLRFHDVYGKQMGKDITLQPDSFTYPVPELASNTSYLCSMTLCETTVRQPVLCGKDDDAYARFVTMRQNLSDEHPRANEIDGVLYRLKFLLGHPTRHEGDWWWQFKITPLTYQMEHTFAHLDDTYGLEDTEANIQFITYQSEQDDSLQRYLLARPNKIRKDTPLPLVVVIRPNIENYHPFFSSPQMARQWALNQMQAWANRYQYIIMMPEMRTYLSEDIRPEAETELKLAIEDVKRHYPIDTSRIYLHANCSGGYRALQIATKNPDMFAAIALYAPDYRHNVPNKQAEGHAPQKLLHRLKGIPMFIHYDPLDGHSTQDAFADLISDCKRMGIPLTLSVKRNSGQFYNVVLVGEEALDFLKDKQKQ